MKNEDCVIYDAQATTATTPAINNAGVFEWCFSNARIKLTGERKAGRKITNCNALSEYCKELLIDEAMESMRIICVDTQCRVIGDAEISNGSIGDVNCYPRKVATFALLMNAKNIFMAHNHPGGTCSPSYDDITGTQQVAKLMRDLGIPVLDHMIVTPDGNTYSMNQHGDVDFRGGR